MKNTLISLTVTCILILIIISFLVILKISEPAGKSEVNTAPNITLTPPPTDRQTIFSTNTPIITSTATSAPSSDETDIELPEGIDTEVLSWWFGKIQNDKMIYEIPDSKRDQAEKYDGIYRKNEDKKVVYFSFDEGYENGYTPIILDILKEKEVKAIFFVTGHYLRTCPELVKRMINEGHLVGNHTDNHPTMPKKSIPSFIKELNSVEKLYEDIIGSGNRMYYYRPPEGSYSERDLYIAQQMGYRTVFWSFAYLDYLTDNQKGYDFAYNSITSSLHKGEILLLHAVSKDNTDVLGDVIDYIRSCGYEIKRIDE